MKQNSIKVIKTLIGIEYSKNILKSLKSLNILNETKTQKLNNVLSKLNTVKYNTLDFDVKFQKLLQEYTFLQNSQSTYLKISQGDLGEYVQEGFSYIYKENRINEPISHLEIINDLKNQLQIERDENKINNLNDKIDILNKQKMDKPGGLFFSLNSDICEFIQYGTQLTVAIVDPLVNNDLTQVDLRKGGSSYEYQFNHVYIAKTFSMCDVNILASVFRNCNNINSIKRLSGTSINIFKSNLELYDNNQESIDFINKLPILIDKYNNIEDFKNELTNLYPQSQDYDYIFNSNEFINRYRKELGIIETIEESQFKLIPSEFLEYISTSKEKEVQEFYKDFCEYFKISYEPLIDYPIDTSKTVSIKKTKNIIEKLFRFEDKYELDPYYKITIPPYDEKQVQKIKELDEMNRKNPQNGFNILTILNPQLTPYMMDKISELEKYKPYSSIPIRNIKLTDNQINDLSDLIKNNEDVWHIRTSDIKIANITKNKETKSIEIDYNKEQSQNIEHNLNIEEIR